MKVVDFIVVAAIALVLPFKQVLIEFEILFIVRNQSFSSLLLKWQATLML